MSTAITVTVVEKNSFAITKSPPDLLPSILRENVGEKINPGDLERVCMPTGGNIAWNIVNDNGEDTVSQELVGVIIQHGTRRRYYALSKDDKDAESGPPDCSSDDGIVGFGMFKGDAGPKRRACATCPKNQWGTRMKGGEATKGKACSERKVLFLLRKDDMLPLVVDLAPTSIKPMREFMMRLTRQGRPVTSVVVSLSLEKAGDKVNPYSVLVPKVYGHLCPEDAENMRKVSEALRPYFAQIGADPVSHDDQDGDKDGGVDSLNDADASEDLD